VASGQAAVSENDCAAL